ncbi:glutathione peroxidase [Marinicrinis sediminis]|uniref:Glutathione peroxidase n=1 Tax=Marinicrinis sediminis TaxID=1652465 RepID=A0ABW5REK7_9BACL
MSIYSYTFTSINGEPVSLNDYKEKVLIVVNTASKCGFTPQYSDLQKLYERYQGQGLEIIGFPCNQFDEQEPGSQSEVQEFCSIHYGVTFPLSEKVKVKGTQAHPLFAYLTEKAPFEGFDMTKISSKMLVSFLEEKYPENLKGDDVKWNFTKFIINQQGDVVGRYEPTTEPLDMEPVIEALLSKS